MELILIQTYNQTITSKHKHKKIPLLLHPLWSRRMSLNMKWLQPLERGGIIPFIKHPKGLRMCLGINNKTGAYTDFSGSKSLFDRDIDDTALRQCRNESLSIFDFTREYLDHTNPIYIFDNGVVIIFLDITSMCKSEDYYTKVFNNNSNKITSASPDTGEYLPINPYRKISKIGWVWARDIIKIIDVIDIQIQSLLQNISNITPLIEFDESFTTCRGCQGC